MEGIRRKDLHRLSMQCFVLCGGKKKYCSLAQSVEHAAVNRGVVSSSLTGAAKKEPHTKRCVVLFLYSLTDTPEGRRLTAARLLIGQSPTAAGGRGREGDCRKKHGGSQAERGEPPMFLTDGVVSSSLTGAAMIINPYI